MIEFQLSVNLQCEIKKREFKELLSQKLQGIDVQSNFYDVLESVVIAAEHYFKEEFKSMKKEAVLEYITPYIKDSKLTEKTIESIVRRLFPKKKMMDKLAKFFREVL